MIANPVVLVINSGSSSVKFALFDLSADEPDRMCSGVLERIGLDSGRFKARDMDGSPLIDEPEDIPNHVVALDVLLAWIEQQTIGAELVGVGHRVVHGGPDCDCALRVTPALEAHLKRLVPLAPLHLPHNLAGIAAIRLRRPDIVQVASFDTAFHHGMPGIAKLTGLPKKFAEDLIGWFSPAASAPTLLRFERAFVKGSTT